MANVLLRASYFLLAAFRLAAQRAFMSCDRRFLPDGVSPPFFFFELFAVLAPLSRSLAQRALAAAANLARVVADTRRRPFELTACAAGAAEPVNNDARLFSRVSICRRIPTASSNSLRDKSIMRNH